MSFFGFGQSADIDVVLNDAETRKKAEHKSEDGRKDKYFLFYDGETVSGKVNVTLKYPGKRLEHNGVKIEFVGQIGERPAPLSRGAPERSSHSVVGRRRGASYRRRSALPITRTVLVNQSGVTPARWRNKCRFEKWQVS